MCCVLKCLLYDYDMALIPTRFVKKSKLHLLHGNTILYNNIKHLLAKNLIYHIEEFKQVHIFQQKKLCM